MKMSLTALYSDCQVAIENIKMLNNDELNEILNSNEKIEEILNGLEQSYLKNIEAEKNQLLETNALLAESNLTREPELMEGRETIVKFSNEGEELRKAIEEKYKEFKEKSGDMSLETALALLQTAASESEEESEKMANMFLNSEMELDDFLDKFLTTRKVMHLRLVKAEKMSKLISREFNIGSNYVNTPPLAINSNYFPSIPSAATNNAVPYPTGPLNMPMPGSINYFQYH